MITKAYKLIKETGYSLAGGHTLPEAMSKKTLTAFIKMLEGYDKKKGER